MGHPGRVGWWEVDRTRGEMWAPGWVYRRSGGGAEDASGYVGALGEDAGEDVEGVGGVAGFEGRFQGVELLEQGAGGGGVGGGLAVLQVLLDLGDVGFGCGEVAAGEVCEELDGVGGERGGGL